MVKPPIKVIENHLTELDGHTTLLLVKYGTLTLEVRRLDERLTVCASRCKPGRGEWTEWAMDANTVERSRQIAWRLVRELGP